MNKAAMFARVVALGLLTGGAAAVTMTSAQAARNADTFSTYDPAHAYTGDPAYESSAQGLAPRERVAPVRATHFRAPANVGPNLPYPDRPYGDPDSW